MEPFRPTYAEINLNNISRNLSEIRNVTGPRVKVMAIVKANAYGHGAVEVAKAAEKAGADYFGVATLGEALEIRYAFVRKPVLILSETSINYLEKLIDADLTQTVYTVEFAQALSDIAKQKKKKAAVHIKVDTGMNRIGMSYPAAIKNIKKIRSLPNLEVEGIFTHFANADNFLSDFTLSQYEKFMELLEDLKSEGVNFKIRHAANSAATLYFPKTHLDMVRIGLCMYGLYPSSGRKDGIDLKPVLSFKTKVMYVKEVPKGTPVSYGSTFLTRRNTRIATLPVGYADGLSRGLSNKGSVLIRGKRYPIAGNVTMDMIMVDAGNDKIEIGDDAVIIGKQGKEEITSDEIAMLDGTINYEVICAIGKRVPRTYIGQN